MSESLDAKIPFHEGDRPSQHGALIGRIISEMERIGRETLPDLPPSCLTCAFTEGSVPNQMAGTAFTAFKCAIGTDPDPFGCHHAMKDGKPIKLCAGYVAAQEAVKVAYDKVAPLIQELSNEIRELQELKALDIVRVKFDEWLVEADPNKAMDVYQVARAYTQSFSK